MKKIILALFILGVIACAPIVKADTLTLTPDMIVQAQFDPEFKAALINYLTTIIQLLQRQLEIMVAQQNITNQIAQNTTPSQPAPAGNNAQIQNMDAAFKFTAKNYGQTLVVVIEEPFDQCRLVVTDSQGHELRNSDQWFKDRDGNMRQVLDVSAGDYTYAITFTKAGETSTSTGTFEKVTQ